MASELNKIIYFDKETISNILQEENKGAKKTQTDVIFSSETSGEINIEAKVKLSVPFWDKLSFLFTGKINASYMLKRDKSTTITTTEISEFDELKSQLVEIPNTLVFDIENSSSFFRVAGGYLRMVKGGVDGVDTKEFKAVMDSYEGYDTYKIDDKRYVRFNTSAFVSNYKRNDLLTTKMTLYCIQVGEFDKEKFDFMKQLHKMQSLLSDVDQNKSLYEAYPPSDLSAEGAVHAANEKIIGKVKTVHLYDVVYACISAGGNNV